MTVAVFTPGHALALTIICVFAVFLLVGGVCWWLDRPSRRALRLRRRRGGWA